MTQSEYDATLLAELTAWWTLTRTPHRLEHLSRAHSRTIKRHGLQPIRLAITRLHLDGALLAITKAPTGAMLLLPANHGLPLDALATLRGRPLTDANGATSLRALFETDPGHALPPNAPPEAIRLARAGRMNEAFELCIAHQATLDGPTGATGMPTPPQVIPTAPPSLAGHPDATTGHLGHEPDALAD